MRQLDIPELDGLYIRPRNPAPSVKPPLPLKRFIDQHDLFTILFTDPALAYIDGALYRDDMLLQGGAQFLKYFVTNTALDGMSSEKGRFSAAHREFDADSVFRVVVDNIAAQDDILACDDLGDEWADFIGINRNVQPKTISFYHAKHGDLSLGAGPFHVAVSQAEKNLGRLSLAEATLGPKLAKWGAPYEKDGRVTNIARLVRGSLPTLRVDIGQARDAPDTIRRVYIVTSSLSRVQLEAMFARIQGGYAPRPYFVQLYWLLSSYFSACLEVGAFPYVICRP